MHVRIKVLTFHSLTYRNNSRHKRGVNKFTHTSKFLVLSFVAGWDFIWLIRLNLRHLKHVNSSTKPSEFWFFFKPEIKCHLKLYWSSNHTSRLLFCFRLYPNLEWPANFSWFCGKLHTVVLEHLNHVNEIMSPPHPWSSLCYPYNISAIFYLSYRHFLQENQTKTSQHHPFQRLHLFIKSFSFTEIRFSRAML